MTYQWLMIAVTREFAVKYENLTLFYVANCENLSGHVAATGRHHDDRGQRRSAGLGRGVPA